MTERFAVAIPAFEAAPSIAAVVARVLAMSAEVVVVDDGSADGTGDAARACGVPVLTNRINLGKGRALKAAFDHLFASGYDAVVTLDADGQHPPEEIPKLLAPWREGADLVLGTRAHLYGAMRRVRRASNGTSSWPITRCPSSWGSLSTVSISLAAMRPTGMPVQSATTEDTAWWSTVGRINGSSPCSVVSSCCT